jgi:hypothetical protein
MVSPCRLCVDTQSHTRQCSHAQVFSRVCWHGITRRLRAGICGACARWLRLTGQLPTALWSCRTAATYSGGCMTAGSILLPCSRMACMQPAAARALHTFLACACRTCRGCAWIVRTHPIGHPGYRVMRVRQTIRQLRLGCVHLATALPSSSSACCLAQHGHRLATARVPLAGFACAGPVGCPLQQSGRVQVVDIGWGAVVGVHAAECTCVCDSCAAGKHVGVLAQFLQTTCKG